MGKLHFRYAAMNAGKSTALLQVAYNYEERGMSVLLFTAAHDDRAGAGIIASRLGLQREAGALRSGLRKAENASGGDDAGRIRTTTSLASGTSLALKRAVFPATVRGSAESGGSRNAPSSSVTRTSTQSAGAM